MKRVLFEELVRAYFFARDHSACSLCYGISSKQIPLSDDLLLATRGTKQCDRDRIYYGVRPFPLCFVRTFHELAPIFASWTETSDWKEERNASRGHYPLRATFP